MNYLSSGSGIGHFHERPVDLLLQDPGRWLTQYPEIAGLLVIALFLLPYLIVRAGKLFAGAIRWRDELDAAIEEERREAQEKAELKKRREALAELELANREKEAAHKAEILGHRDSAIAREKKREEEERRHAAELAAIRDRMQGGHR